MSVAARLYSPQQQQTCWHRLPLKGHGTVLVDDDLNVGVHQGSVPGPLHYLLFTVDLPVWLETTSVIFADNTALIATDNSPAIASCKLQTNLLAIQSRLTDLSQHITFTTRGGRHPVHINNVHLPQTEEVKHLGLHLDRRLTWHKHIFTKRKQLRIALTKMYWVLGRKSKLCTNNKLLIYKTILKPIWAYGIQLWETASTSNIEIIVRFQSKALLMITDAPWYLPNTVIRKNLQIPTVKHEISRCYQYGKSLRRTKRNGFKL
jgi:hypothetical protein